MSADLSLTSSCYLLTHDHFIHISVSASSDTSWIVAHSSDTLSSAVSLIIIRIAEWSLTYYIIIMTCDIIWLWLLIYLLYTHCNSTEIHSDVAASRSSFSELADLLTLD